MYKSLLELLLITVLTTSCITETNNTVEYKRIPEAKWMNNDTVIFHLLVPVGGSCYNLSLLLRLNNDYEYLELPYNCEIENSFGFSRLYSGIVKIAERPGDFRNFNGRSYRQFKKEVALGIKLPLAGLYKIKVFPSTTLPHFRGVENVGFLSEPQTVLIAPPAGNYPSLPIDQPPSVRKLLKKESINEKK